MNDDAELLGRYAETGDEQAFAELVERHVGLVYSVATRQVGGDTHPRQGSDAERIPGMGKKRRGALTGTFRQRLALSQHLVRGERCCPRRASASLARRGDPEQSVECSRSFSPHCETSAACARPVAPTFVRRGVV